MAVNVRLAVIDFSSDLTNLAEKTPKKATQLFSETVRERPLGEVQTTIGGSLLDLVIVQYIVYSLPIVNGDERPFAESQPSDVIVAVPSTPSIQ